MALCTLWLHGFVSMEIVSQYVIRQLFKNSTTAFHSREAAPNPSFH